MSYSQDTLGHPDKYTRYGQIKDKGLVIKEEIKIWMEKIFFD
jgi:hypothetical protein